MKAFSIFSLFTVGVASSLLLTATNAYAWGSSTKNISNKVITDSLVRNLQCNSLSTDRIYAAIRDDAFNETRNIPVENWAFNSGGFPIANCWALSSTQRMFSYLARYNEPTAPAPEEQTEMILNQIRRSEPILDKKPGARVRDYPLRRYQVFKLAEDSLRRGYFLGEKSTLAALQNGVQGRDVSRSFKQEVEFSQSFRFFRFSNVGMGAGSGPREANDNVETANRLMLNLNGKRLTLINLRVTQTSQHVVMAKSYTRDSSGLIRFKVYDSNQPTHDQTVIYDPISQQFYAPNILMTNEALGTFIVSEDERGDFEKALMRHYAEACK